MFTKKATFTLLLLFLLAACRAPEDTQPTQDPASILATRTVELTRAAQPEPPTPVPSATPVVRKDLPFEDLMDGFETSAPVPETAFAMPPEAGAAKFVFEGRLELIGEDTIGAYALHRGEEPLEEELYHLPEFDFAFVQADGYLVPVQRGRIVTEHPTWNYIIGPGRVWQEAGDQGYSRVSFPFTLVPKGGNSTFNGTMTFLFNADSISKVWYQVTQETSFNLRVDLWGLYDAVYHAEPVPGAETVREAFQVELARRIPTAPIETLVEKYPGIDTGAFGSGLSAEHLNGYGFVVDGVNYVSGCQARYGPYTYCESMRFASWSTAKSAFAGTAMMRLTQQFGPDVPQILAADYVPEAASAPGDWSQVTLDNVLDMATGNYDSSQWMRDEEQFDSPFWASEDYAGMITAAFDWPYRAEPGTRWVYHTSDTFIAVAAMQNYLRAQTVPDADLYQYVVDEVYIPIGVGPGAHTSARTSDNDWSGQAFGGTGLWWIPDDIAKIAMLFQAGGVYEGTQLLDPGLVAAALQRDPDDRGVRASAREMYNNGFWSMRYGEAQGYACEFWVAEMLGYTGVVVVLMPNRTSYYYFSDNRDFYWDPAVHESDRIMPFCQGE